MFTSSYPYIGTKLRIEEKNPLVLMGNVSCNGNESSLTNCVHLTPCNNTILCSTAEVASVRCYPSKYAERYICMELFDITCIYIHLEIIYTM